MRCEILTDPMMASRGARMLQAMADVSPIPVCVRNSYVGDCELLMVYGTGHPVRRPWWLRHIKKGRPAIAWDLGYWSRPEGAMRATMNADHPQAMIRAEDGDRWRAAGIDLRADYDPSGPVILVGLGIKAVHAGGFRPGEWETMAMKALRKHYPAKRIIFRPKRPADPVPGGLKAMRHEPIEEVLRGASLVVCRHSNVAVDACIAGIPVRCEDGAAKALYADNPHPTPEQRLQFLQGLAYWQWKPEEASEAWKYLIKRLSA